MNTYIVAYEGEGLWGCSYVVADSPMEAEVMFYERAHQIDLDAFVLEVNEIADIDDNILIEPIILN